MNLTARLVRVTQYAAGNSAVLRGGRELEYTEQLAFVCECIAAFIQLKRPGGGIPNECVTFGIILPSSIAALTHGRFDSLIQATVQVHDFRGKQSIALWLRIVRKAMV